MARQRMINPTLWTDEGMGELTHRQQLLYIGLICNADDEGRLKRSASGIALMLPTVYRAVPVGEIEDDLLCVMSAMTKLVEYEVDGRPYLCFVNYRIWQTINRPTPSKLPPPPWASREPSGEVAPPGMSTHGTITDDSLNAHPQVKLTEEKLNQGKGSEGKPYDRQPAAADPAPGVAAHPAPPDAADPPPAPRPRDPLKERRAELLRVFKARVWPAWPRKVNRQQAETAFVRLAPTDEQIARIVAAIPVQSAALDWPRENWRYCPHLATWLNQRRFEDEVADGVARPPVRPAGGAPLAPQQPRRTRHNIDVLRRLSDGHDHVSGPSPPAGGGDQQGAERAAGAALVAEVRAPR